MNRTVINIVGWVMLLGGVLLLLQTGNVAVALGVAGPVPEAGAGDPVAREFWRQLTFIRMFAAASIGFAVICFWCRSQLNETQQRSLLKVLSGVFTVMGGMALAQQVAIWDRAAGWAVVGVLASLLLACVAGAAKRSQTAAG